MTTDSDLQDAIYRPDRLEVVETGDGSSTLYDPARNAHFSSLHGARTESHHIFVEGTALLEAAGTRRVLELGFGAGINFRETARAFDRDARLIYHAVDYAPVSPDDLPFDSGPYLEAVREVLAGISTGSGDSRPSRWSGDRIELVVHPLRWRELDLESFQADAVFYDPFGPKREPDSWSVDCFRKARRRLAPDAVLGTYSAASDVKRAMFEAGLSVATAPGPGPKREITYAARSESPLEALPEAELLRRSRYIDRVDD